MSITTDLFEQTTQGYLPTIVFLEGDPDDPRSIVFLDEAEAAEELAELDDRDVRIAQTLLHLALERVDDDLARRRRNKRSDENRTRLNTALLATAG